MLGKVSGVRLPALGELRAEVDGAAAELGGRRQRAMLARLLLARGGVGYALRLPAEAVDAARPIRSA